MKPHSFQSFNHIGKWQPKPRRSEILTCVCGNKYIKTRKNQIECLRCMNHTVVK